ncbi:hypothetical protein GGX14DRAFT_398538 [Mycena pura]|uniref:Uncharacterized protein n=1 Tax=Mycena pura TaxID=153505 RepID=A0AAD6V8C2_9AGAR|nr:hypothetical protein GGX14DRAFT_398538 [Mycena pura]
MSEAQSGAARRQGIYKGARHDRLEKKAMGTSRPPCFFMNGPGSTSGYIPQKFPPLISGNFKRPRTVVMQRVHDDGRARPRSLIASNTCAKSATPPFRIWQLFAAAVSARHRTSDEVGTERENEAINVNEDNIIFYVRSLREQTAWRRRLKPAASAAEHNLIRNRGGGSATLTSNRAAKFSHIPLNLQQHLSGQAPVYATAFSLHVQATSRHPFKMKFAAHAQTQTRAYLQDREIHDLKR